MAGLWLQRLGKYGALQLLNVPVSPAHQGWETQTLTLAQPFTKLPVENSRVCLVSVPGAVVNIPGSPSIPDASSKQADVKRKQ